MYEKMYHALFRIRRIEEEIARIYPTDKIKSPCHLSIGQEAVSVGVCDALRPEDAVFGTYRGHALYLAKGGDLKKMIAELYGKATGCAKGKGGSMHLVDAEAGVMGASAVVGTTIPQAVGYAYARKIQGQRTVVASFFGDGATEEGAFHESLNFAALKRVPVLFVCENNLYAIHASQESRQPVGNICERARCYGMPAYHIEGNDVLDLNHCAQKAAEAIREGGGPQFIECMTYRWREHVGPNEDFHTGYRPRSEADIWFETDQLARLAELTSASVRKALEAEVEAEIRDAFAFAEESPWPDDAELFTDLFREAHDGAYLNLR